MLWPIIWVLVFFSVASVFVYQLFRRPPTLTIHVRARGMACYADAEGYDDVSGVGQTEYVAIGNLIIKNADKLRITIIRE